jgi:hypothetical protein
MKVTSQIFSATSLNADVLSGEDLTLNRAAKNLTVQRKIRLQKGKVIGHRAWSSWTSYAVPKLSTGLLERRYRTLKKLPGYEAAIPALCADDLERLALLAASDADRVLRALGTAHHPGPVQCRLDRLAREHRSCSSWTIHIESSAL